MPFIMRRTISGESVELTMKSKGPLRTRKPPFLHWPAEKKKGPYWIMRNKDVQSSGANDAL